MPKPFKQLYAELTEILNADDSPDQEAVTRIIQEIAAGNLYPPIFDGLAWSIVRGGDIEEEIHRLRAIWRLARWDRAEYSRAWLANRKGEA
jgi:hypothetical protein